MFHFGTPTRSKTIKTSFTYFLYKFKGNHLDSFARKSLRDKGLDYAHGTGHGIGPYLKPISQDPSLEANMFLSNKPGY